MKKQIAMGLATALSAQASIIGWNVDQFSTVSAATGVVPSLNWNNTVPAGAIPYVGTVVSNLIDDTGTTSTLDIAYGAWGGWRMQASHPGTDGDGSNNKELLNGYLNAGPAPWNPSVTASSVALSEIPYPKYHLIVYFSSDVADREGSVTDGTTTCYFKSLGPASISGSNAILTQATDTTTAGYETGANYAVFNGLSGPTKTLTVQMRDNDEWGGIAGFQIVADLGTMPEFAIQPVDKAGAVDSVVIFTSAAAADPAPTYQWEYSLNGTSGWKPLDGQTSAELTLVATLADEGYYRVIATNPNGSVTSNKAFLDVFYAPPVITTQPADAYATEGSTVQLSVVATGYDTLTYQWYKGATLLSGKTSDTLVLSNVSSADAGAYHVAIADSVEVGLTKISNDATVYVIPAWNGLVSQDPFSPAAGYTLGELPLQNPPVTGYTDAWTDINFGDAEPEVLAGPLTYADPLYLGSTGDHVGKAADTAGVAVANSGRVYRKFAPAHVVAGNTTGVRYLSWLYQNGNQNAAANATTHSTLALYHNTGGVAPAGDAALRVFSAGISDADYGSTNFGFRYNDLLTGDLAKPIDSNVHLFVAKFDLSATGASDSITVWIDPVLGPDEPSGGITLTGLDVAFEAVAFSDYASNSAAWDELRWGSSFASVTLNTNPAPTYAAWIAGYPGIGGQTGFNQDPDGDGIRNGLENVFGTNPGASNPGITNIRWSGSSLTFQHPQNASVASDVSAVSLWSNDLVQWHASGEASGGTTVTFSSNPNTPAAGITTVTGAVSGTVPAKLFVRMKAVQAAP